MAKLMVRKQIYLERAQDRKVRAIAESRGWTEAAVIREAIDRLPDAEDDVIGRLEAAGLLAPKPPLDAPLSDEELRARELEVAAIMNRLPPELSLSEMVIEDREGR